MCCVDLKTAVTTMTMLPTKLQGFPLSSVVNTLLHDYGACRMDHTCVADVCATCKNCACCLLHVVVFRFVLSFVLKE